MSGAAARAQQRLFRAERQSARRLSTTFRFASGSSRLDAKALHDVQRLVAFARAPGQRGKTLVFAGFTDAAGSPAVNAALAARRALQVRSAVLAAARGPVPFVATQVRGFGAVAPVACNSEGADKLLNRRVEVWLR